jgi:hypothetical protein
MRSLLRLLATAVAVTSMASPAGPALGEPVDPRMPARIKMLTRATVWTQVAAIKLRFKTFHPQGMVRIGDDFYVSSVEIRKLPQKLPAQVDGHAYDTGAGIGHLFKIGPDGRLMGDLILGEGSIYHPGGIDYDGTSIWVPVAEYRSHSRAIVYEVSPATMAATVAFTVADHIGGVIHDTAARRIEGMTWGSRQFYSWPDWRKNGMPTPTTSMPIVNPENYIDYQDCHYAGGSLALCAGVAEYGKTADKPAFQLGGVDLVDLTAHRPIWQAPIALWAPSGRAMTQNPFWVEVTLGGLRAYFIPDDDESTLFVFDAHLL